MTTSRQPCVSGNVQREPIPLAQLKGVLDEEKECMKYIDWKATTLGQRK